jgi:hypothetical protein
MAECSPPVGGSARPSLVRVTLVCVVHAVYNSTVLVVCRVNSGPPDHTAVHPIELSKAVLRIGDKKVVLQITNSVHQIEPREAVLRIAKASAM